MAHQKSLRKSLREQKRDIWYRFNTGEMDENLRVKEAKKFRKNTADDEAREKFAPRFDNRSTSKKK